MKFVVLIATCFLVSCSDDIVRTSDYEIFLNSEKIAKAKSDQQAEMHFWKERLEGDTSSFVNKLQLGIQYMQRFRLNGEVRDLEMADSLVSAASQKLNHSDPELMYTLSQISVSRHSFAEAMRYAVDAGRNGGDRYTADLLRFDAAMELGEFSEAGVTLNSFRNKKSFDYLLRKAKLEDYNGNLDRAIELMEEAFEIVKPRGTSVFCWARSNLADMYGHAGRIDDAYNAYLEVLEKDPTYLYALKGIAWIAYSRDHNTEEAKRILQYILSQSNIPELYLVLAEIAEWEGNGNDKKEWERQFISLVRDAGYGDMYSKYLIALYSDDPSTIHEALVLAKKEIANRATPETYAWLAWAYFKNGETSKAYDIVMKEVYGKTFEPEALLQTAYIFEANGMYEKAGRIFNDLPEAEFELGPVTTRIIKKKLRGMN